MRHTALVLLIACSPAHPLPDGDACAPSPLATDWLRPLVTGTVAHLAQTPRYLETEKNPVRAYLADQLASLGLAPQMQMYPTGINVYTTLDGVTSDVVVFGAHYDTVSGSPGADDNATGVAVALAAAHYLRDTPCRGPSVMIAFFDQEEEGLFGSRAFAGMLAGTNVIAAHTIDQAGWDADSDGRFELELPTPALEQEYRSAATVVGATLVTTTTSGTDHEAFREAGFPAVGLTEGYTSGDTSPYRHTPQDTASTVDADFLVLAAELVGQVAMREIATTN